MKIRNFAYIFVGLIIISFYLSRNSNIFEIINNEEAKESKKQVEILLKYTVFWGQLMIETEEFENSLKIAKIPYKKQVIDQNNICSYDRLELSLAEKKLTLDGTRIFRGTCSKRESSKMTLRYIQRELSKQLKDKVNYYSNLKNTIIRFRNYSFNFKHQEFNNWILDYPDIVKGTIINLFSIIEREDHNIVTMTWRHRTYDYSGKPSYPKGYFSHRFDIKNNVNFLDNSMYAFCHIDRRFTARNREMRFNCDFAEKNNGYLVFALSVSKINIITNKDKIDFYDNQNNSGFIIKFSGSLKYTKTKTNSYVFLAIDLIKNDIAESVGVYI